MDISSIEIPGAGVTLRGLEAVPGKARGIPVMMIHENRGLQPYMVDVIGSLAAQGHHVIAPDLLTRVGGTSATAADDALTTRAIGSEIHEADLIAAFDWFAARVDAVAVLGFCFGGEMGWRLVTRRVPDRAVLLYGVGPPPNLVSSIRCPVYSAYAEDDDRVNRTLPPLLEALLRGNVDVTAESWPGTRHAFHDHSRPDRHNPRAAEALWDRVLAFLEGKDSAAS